MQAATIEQKSAADVALRSSENDSVINVTDGLHLMPRLNLATVFLYEASIGEGDTRKINDPSGWRMQRFDACRVWLKLAQTLRSNHLQAFNAIGHAATKQLF
jgi:hypothetical protein